jgi:tetratricopeptide (TPR) repeat protein
VEQSLVQRDLDAQGRLRFSMLETLREFALERLQESGEMAAVQERHTRCYVALAEEAIHYSVTDEAPYWLDLLDNEIENLRAALEWSLSAGGEVELGARLANDLFWFWYLRGHIVEGQSWYRRFIQSNVEKNTAAYAGVLTGAGVMANWLGDQAAARRLLDESIPFLRKVGDRQELAQALMNRGIIAINEGREDVARPDLEEALEAFRALGQRFFSAVCLMHLANVVMTQGQPETARRLLAETAAIARSIGDRWLLPAAISSQGEIARFQGDYNRAGGFYDESGALFHEINARGDLARTMHNQAYVALRRGDIRLADSLFRQSLDLYRQLGIQRGIAECLAGLADVNATQGKLMPAARLLGFAQAMIGSLGMDWWPADRREIETARANLQHALGEELFTVQEAAGRSQKLEEVLGGL